MSSKHDRTGQAPHLRVIHGGDDGEDEEILEEGFHVIDDDDVVSDPWLKAGGDPADPPGVIVDTDPTVLEEDLALPPLRDRHEETKPEIPQQALDARRRGDLPSAEETATEPGPEEMATVPRAPMPEPPGAVASSTALPTAQLRVLEGPDVGTTFALTEPVVTVGRSSECQVTLRDLSMSRRHAEIRRAGRRAFEIRDLDSRNGTTVDGRPAKSWTAAAPGAVLQVGDVRLRLEVEDLSEPTLLRPGGLGVPLDPPMPPPPARAPQGSPRPRPGGGPAPRAPAPRAPAPRAPAGRGPAPRTPAPRSPAPRAPTRRGGADRAPGARVGPKAAPAALGTLAKGALAVALGAAISWLLAWLLFFASFAPLGSHTPAPVAAGPSPTAAVAAATPAPQVPAKAAPAPTAAATTLAAARAAAARQDWVVAVHEARLVPKAAPEHPAAAELLHSVSRDVVDPRLDKARHQIAAHHPGAAEETLLATLEIWPHQATAEALLAKARDADRAALAPPPKPHPVAHHRTSHPRHARRHPRHVAHHAAPPASPPADAGLLRKARQAFAQKHLHSALAAADAAADLGGTAARKLDDDLHAFEGSWNTASRTRDIATALGAYTDALYRARHIAPPRGGDFGAAIRKALGQAHYVAALQAQKAGQNQAAISHAQKALGYDPNNRGARSLLHVLMR